MTGYNFFLLQSISTDPNFAEPVPVPDGYSGNTLTVPHLSAATLFFKLRDDPASVDSAVLPVTAPAVIHVHVASHVLPGKTDSPATTKPEKSAPTKEESPAPVAPSSPPVTVPSPQS
jgi:hypothetical protein